MVKFGYIPDISGEELLRSHTEEQVFSLLFGGIPIHEGMRVCSPLREDNRAGCTFREYMGRLYFVDFGDTITHRDCFDMVKAYYGLGSYQEAIVTAYTMLEEGKYPKERNDRRRVERSRMEGQSSSIFVRPRGWMACDRDYWQPYGITRSQLDGDGVVPLTEFALEGKSTWDVSSLCYAYTNLSNGRIKLYFPKRKRARFMGNANADSIGIINGCKESDTLTVTKSYKDARVLANAGLRVVWLQNEGMLPSNEVIGRMVQDCQSVLLVFDCDGAGEMAVQKVGEALGRYRQVKIGRIPSGRKDVKDSSDYRKVFGEYAMNSLVNEWLKEW